jgi:hypothetical protein
LWSSKANVSRAARLAASVVKSVNVTLFPSTGNISKHRRTVMKKLCITVAALAVLALAGRLVQADPVAGADWLEDNVQAYSTNIYRVSFYGGELARVRVIGDGDTDLDLYVLDENGHVVAADTDYTDTCVVVWQPRWTGRFTIRVVNCGSVYNHFALAVD